MKESWYEQWWFILLLVLVAVIVIVFMNKTKHTDSIQESIAQSSKNEYYPVIGDVILIGLPDFGGGIVARNPLYLDEYLQAEKNNDETRIAKLEGLDKVFILKEYTIALVIDLFPINNMVKIRILEGQHYGEAAYTLDMYCKIKKTIVDIEKKRESKET